MTKPRYYTPAIPNGWFCIGYEDEIPAGGVQPLKYFGKDLVLFRTESGQLTVLDAFILQASGDGDTTRLEGFVRVNR